MNNFNCINSINDLSTDSDDESLNFINNNNNDDVTTLNKLVQLYNKYETQLKNINNKKKLLTTKMINTKKYIQSLMEKNEVDYINININNGGGKLKYNKKKTFSTLSKKHLDNLLKTYFNDNIKLANDLLIFLYNNREYKEKISITKTKK